MNILHVITGLTNGGAEAVLYRLTEGDKSNLHQVVSLTDMGVYGERFRSLNIRVHTLDMPRGRVTVKGLVKFYRIVRSVKPNIVQCWMYHADLIGGIVARLAGANTVIWGIRGSLSKKKTSLKTKITIYTCALLSKWIPRIIISNSNSAAKVHIQAGYTSEKLVTIPNGYSLKKYQLDECYKDKIFEEFKLERSKVTIGMIARFHPVKDHENLFRALSTLVDLEFKCLLVGPGMEESNLVLMQLIKKYGLQKLVKLVGPRTDIPNIMSALDLHVLSSSAESFPNVVAEAMACGTPCITTDVGDAAIIVDQTGWVVPHSNPKALASAIKNAMEEMTDLRTWEERKIACQKRINENYTLEKMIDSYNITWGEVISGSR